MRKEILILSACKHPNIVNYVSSYFYNDMLWVYRFPCTIPFNREYIQVVMEYCDGGTLRNFCNKTSPKENEIAYLCREVSHFLTYSG